MNHQGVLILSLSALLLFSCSGCGEVSPSASAAGQRFVSRAAIAGETPIHEVRKQLLAEEGPESLPVVVRGRIYTKEMPPFEEGEAAFTITDTTGHDGDTNHDPWECPFCKQNIGDYLAHVRFLNDVDQVIQTDARELLGVDENYQVIVEGTARMREDGLLQIDAFKLHVKQ